MTARTSRRETRRFRLAGNDNEIVVGLTRPRPFPELTRPRPFPEATAGDDVEGHRLAGNDNETVVSTSLTRPRPFPEATGGADADNPR